MSVLELQRPSSDTAPAEDEVPPRTGIARIALLLTYGCAASLPWNGWKLGGIRPGDELMLLGLLAFAASDVGRVWPRLPRWVWQFGGMILLVTVLHELLPTDPRYLAQRIVVDAQGFPVPEIESNLVVGLKFVVPIIMLPMLFGFAYLHDRRAIYRCMYAFAVGSAISGMIGFTDRLHITHLSATITGKPAAGGRALGLTVHPNFLALTCILGLPIVLWDVLAPTPRRRFWGVVVLVPLLLGVYASGSRGGAAVFAGTLFLSFALMPAYRRALPTVALISGGLVAAVFAVQPSVGKSLLQAMRLAGNTGSASGSDAVRAMVGHQGILDFQHSPIDGVGMQVAEEAHDVYLQALAAGGLLLLAGYVAFVGFGLAKGLRQTRWDELAVPLFVAATAGAVFGFVQSELTDRLTYVPLALIAVLPVARASHPDFAAQQRPAD